MHHTKFKADIGLAKVISDLVCKGHIPCLPFSEHQPYDLVVVRNSGIISKLQVKYATLKENGIINVKFQTSWTDKHGTHMKKYLKADFDFYAIYCPEKEIVLYVPNDGANSPKVIRFDKACNNQNKKVRWASSYFNLP